MVRLHSENTYWFKQRNIVSSQSSPRPLQSCLDPGQPRGGPKAGEDLSETAQLLEHSIPGEELALPTSPGICLLTLEPWTQGTLITAHWGSLGGAEVLL